MNFEKKKNNLKNWYDSSIFKVFVIVLKTLFLFNKMCN